MEAKHTPGPWHVEPLQADEGKSLAITSKESGIIAIIEPDDMGVFTKGTDKANASLIAAAPELLAFAKKAHMCFNVPSSGCKACELIAKADGK